MTRLEHLNAAIAAGDGLVGFARRIDVTPAGALKWVKKYHPGKHAELIDAKVRGFDDHKALVRLLLIKSVQGVPHGMTRLAGALKLNPESLYNFVRRWAP